MGRNRCKIVNYRQTFFQWEYHSLNALLLLLCVAYFPLSRGSILADIPEIVIPIGVSLGLAVYSIQKPYGSAEIERMKQIAMYGWGGAIVAFAGSWWFVRQLQRELAIMLLLDDALTVLSIGSGFGVFAGALVLQTHSPTDDTDRDRLLAETVWTNDEQPNSILTTIATEIAELDGVGPLELEPLYNHIDPEVFSELRTQEDSHWQLLFYRDAYEIRVSSQGTVTIYGTDEPDEEYSLTVPPIGE